MIKKIDNSVLEHLRNLCYAVVLGEMIDQETRNDAKRIVENHLNNGGYKIHAVKCDQENNPPDLIDSNRMKIEISEEDFSGSSSQIIHTIIL